MLEIYTAIALIVDRSGSMYSVADDTKGSVENLIQEQKKEEGIASLTLVQFDHEYEVVHDFAPLQEVDEKEFTRQYQPRGSTALVDAIGRTIISMSDRIESMDESKKPTRVVVAIVTDGLENASHEFTAEKVKALVNEKQELGWDFIYLGADLDAVHTAGRYGFAPEASAIYDEKNITEAMKAVNTKISCVRQGGKAEFTNEERDQLAKAE